MTSSPFVPSPDAAVYVISVAAELTGLHPQTLRAYERIVAAGVFLLRFVDLYWLIGPDLAGHHGDGHGGSAFHLTYVTAAVGVGGAWLWAFFGAVRQAPLLPVGDPEIRELLAHPTSEGAHG